MDRPPKFLADEMLGSLARWLRIAGYDAAYVKGLPDKEILELAKKEERVLLTRDRQLAERAGEGGLLITTPVLDEQLMQVVGAFGLRLEQRLTRCTLCNSPLKTATLGEVLERVPERVRETSTEFYVCQGCGQVYWKGSHWRRMNEKLDKLRAYNSPR